MKPLFAHLKQTPTYQNLGDEVSCPQPYLFPDCESVCLTKVEEGEAPLIIGGGGIFYGDWPERYAKWAKQRPVIAWGCGLNFGIDGDLTANVERSARAMKEFALVGIRDRDFAIEHGFEWVPCASCLNPAFDHAEPGPVSYELGFYTHPWFDVDPAAFRLPCMSNMGVFELKHVLEFILSCKVLLTNSYHGAYWAQLLGVPVLLLAPRQGLLPNRFYTGLPYVPPVVHSLEEAKVWLLFVPEFRTAPKHLLRECRSKNMLFKPRVLDTLKGL